VEEVGGGNGERGGEAKKRGRLEGGWVGGDGYSGREGGSEV